MCQTPSSINNGYLAIALYDDGVLIYTTRAEKVRKVFQHSTHYDGSYNHFPKVYMDVIVHNGRVVAVDDQGFIYAWHLDQLISITCTH